MAKRKQNNGKLQKLANRLKKIKAKDIMTKHVVTIREDAKLAEVAELMVKERISGLPVLNRKGHVSGIITMPDLFVIMDMIESGEVSQESAPGKFDLSVKFAMSGEVSTIKKNTPLNDIIVLVKYRNVHTLPVMEGTKMLGVIGRRDILKNFYSVVKSLT